MHTIKMVETLTLHELPEWENLVTHFLGPGVHPGRQKGFCLAREALRLALKEQGEKVEISDLGLQQHCEVSKAKKWTISISHTPLWGAAIIGDKKEYRSVGIDIEPMVREVKQIIRERISHPEDMNLRNLELWCVKEAAFKAAMNTLIFEKPIEFSDLLITHEKWTHLPSKIQGEWHIQNLHEHMLTSAWIKN
jgi:phosphopantetheinyl transferase (holo-ACP synthase)